MRKFLLLLLCLNAFAAEDPGAPARSLWNAHVESILTDNCTKCHAGVKQKAGVDLRAPATVLKGGDEGPIVLPGNPKDSKLIKALMPGADPKMPPTEGKQLSEEQIAILSRWIEKLPSTNAPLTAPIFSPSKPAVIPDWAWKTQPSKVVDHFIEARWKELGIKPAAVANDAAFARRVYLDLIGRIPTAAELAEVKDRAGLVERLLESPEYAVHMREVFDVVLMGRVNEAAKAHRNKRRTDEAWAKFLETAFARNRPWDQIVRQIILARPVFPEDLGAEWFVFERRDNHQLIAESIAPIAFGVQIKCAQCHGHPLVPEIEQRHYWGLVAAFNRSKNSNEGGRAVAESAIGGFVNYADLRKRTLPAELVFLNGKAVKEDRPGENVKEVDSKDKYIGKAPKFSRREELANAATIGNPALARAFVNRMWAMLMGRGLVHPVDQIDSRHPASHPEVLEFLAKDFARNNYDVKRLIRVLTATRAYQLDSKIGKDVTPEVFARALDKPLSAEQLHRSLLVAATGEVPKADAEPELLGSLVERFPDLFAAEYNSTVQQVMFMSNNAGFDKLAKGKTVEEAEKISDLAKRVEFLFERTLQRGPDREELRAGVEFLKRGRAGDLFWTLVTGPEFLLNH